MITPGDLSSTSRADDPLARRLLSRLTTMPPVCCWNKGFLPRTTTSFRRWVSVFAGAVSVAWGLPVAVGLTVAGDLLDAVDGTGAWAAVCWKRGMDKSKIAKAFIFAFIWTKKGVRRRTKKRE